MKLGKEDRLYYLAEDLLSGALQVGYENLSGEYGYYDQGGATITISRALMGGGKEGSAKLAAALAHEGTHAYGNRVEGLAHMEALGTYSDIVAMFKLKGDASFASEMLSGVMAAENWSENTGDRDYWKFDAEKKQWSWDKDFDFTVGEHKISAENMQQYIAAQKAAAAIAGTFNLSVGSGEKPGVYIRSAGKRESNGYTALFDAFILSGGDVLAQYDRFLDGTGHFADASVQAKTMIAGDITQDGIDKMNAALYAAQESGLLKGNSAISIDTSNLIGQGTTDIPYFSIAGKINTKGEPFVNITSYDKWRINDKSMAGINGNYVINEFSPYSHEGLDGVGSGNIVASLEGNVYLKYLRAEGLQINLESSIGTFNTGHAGLESIKQYFNLFSSAGTALNYQNGSYKLSGIKAGTVIGYIGNTGINSTGAHAHMALNGKGAPFADIFNNSYYSRYLVPTPYAKYMSGYSDKNYFNNPRLWENVRQYGRVRPDLFNYNDFYKAHYIESFYTKYPE